MVIIVVVVVVVVMVWHSYGRPCGIVAERTSRFSRSERLLLGRNDSRRDQSKSMISVISTRFQKGKIDWRKNLVSFELNFFFLIH